MVGSNLPFEKNKKIKATLQLNSSFSPPLLCSQRRILSKFEINWARHLGDMRTLKKNLFAFGKSLLALLELRIF